MLTQSTETLYDIISSAFIDYLNDKVCFCQMYQHLIIASKVQKKSRVENVSWE